jgi:hypothetical protein
MVLFDTKGADMIVPCDEMIAESTLTWLGGKKFENKLGMIYNIALMRARANPQRFPEIWTYSCEFDNTEGQMRELWSESPQLMADLVRSKGKCHYRSIKEERLIS